MDSFGAVLLRAGRADQMSNQGRLRVLRNLGIGFALPPDPLPFEPQAPHQHLSSQQHVAQQHVAQWSDFATNAAGATLPTKGLLAITGSSVVAALALWGGVNAFDASTAPVRTTSNTPSSPVVLVDGADANVPIEVVPAQLVETVVDAGEERAKTAPKRLIKPPAIQRKDTLSRQLELVDQARAALQSNKPSQALRLLNTYRSEFPRGSLGSEATILRVEALVARGNHAQARRVGDAFLKRAPNSPYSRRLRSLLEHPAATAR